MDKSPASSPSTYAKVGDASTSTSASSESSIDAIKVSNAAPSLKDHEDDEENEDVCRICRNPGDTKNPLLFPCACSGSIKYVHQDCLLQWLNHSNARHCEVCKQPFGLSPVYAENAPTKLPFQQFIVGIIKKTCHIIHLLVRYGFKLSIWLLIIPSIINLIFRLAFVRSFDEADRLILKHIFTTNILTNCLYGFLLSITVTFIFLGLYFFWEHEVRERNEARRIRPPLPHENGQEIAIPGQMIQRDVAQAQARPIFPFLKLMMITLWITMIFVGFVFFLPFSLGRVFLHYMFSITSSDLITLGTGYMLIFSPFFLYLIINELFRYTRKEPMRIERFYFLVKETMSMLKLTFLPVTYFGVLPLLCGLWLDICTVKMFGNSIPQRVNFFKISPFTSSLLHWGIGILYWLVINILYSLVEKVLRSEIDIFGRKSDSNYKSFRDLMDKSLYKQARIVLLVSAIRGCLIVLLVFLPVKLAIHIAPSIFPLNVSVSCVYTEIPALMLLYEMRIPFVIKHFELQKTIKSLLHYWFMIVGSVLGLTNYLLPPPEDNGSGAHERQNDEQVETVFVVRIMVLLVLAWLTLVIFNTSLIIASVSLGRALFTVISLIPIINGIKFNDLYAFIIGSYVIWSIVSGIRYCIEQIIAQRAKILLKNLRKWSVIVSKSCILISIWILVIPVLIGRLFKLLVIIPMWFLVDEIPDFLLYEEWALGIILISVGSRLVMMRGAHMDDSWGGKLRRVKANGFGRVEGYWVVKEIFVPIIVKLVTALCVPYVLSRGVFPVFGYSEVINLMVYRFAWLGCMGFGLMWYCVKRLNIWLMKVHDCLRDERYLIGRRVHNFGEEQIAK